MVYYVKINNSNSKEVNAYKIFTQKKACTKIFNSNMVNTVVS